MTIPRTYGFPVAIQTPPPSPVIASRDPSTLDVGFKLGTVWVNGAIGRAYILVALGGGSATWSQATTVAGALSTLTGNDSVVVTPTATNINVVGGAGITTTGSGSTLTITNTGIDFLWQAQSTNAPLVKDVGFVATIATGTTVTFTLPTTASLPLLGDEYAIASVGADATALFKIQCNAGQILYIENGATSAGGSITSNSLAVSCQIICRDATPGAEKFQIENLSGSFLAPV